MSRETKIGMLTGLLVIVLIGVLLSEYLGNNNGGAAPRAAVAAGGEPARKAIREPAVAPGLVKDTLANAMVAEPVQGMPEVPQKMAADNRGPVITPPAELVRAAEPRDAAPALETLAAGPTRAGTVDLGGFDPTGAQTPVTYITESEARKAELAGRTEVRGATPVTAVPPTLTLPPGQTAQMAAQAPKTTTETYVISPRDTLTIIAKKFYKSATKADLARIVAANKGMLKDETTPLVVGKKLTITDVPAGKPTMPAVGPMTPVMSDVRPIDGQAVTRTPTPTPAAPVASKTYVVQKNDTIERIAKKFGGNTQATMKAIMAANGIKADTVLQVGQKLKVPDAAPTAVASEGHARM